MEIPYLVEARKDTGLFNSKLAIWLFLASEVMLFGGLFSAYVFLRIGADFPWPERTLPILPGLINTFVLIASSVAVVMAWASLKLRKKMAFNLWMAFTVFCAIIFMGLKSIEYNAKFHHHAARLKDFTVVEGHLEKGSGLAAFETTGFVFDSEFWHDGYFQEISKQLTEYKQGEQSSPLKLSLLSPDWNQDKLLRLDEVVFTGPAVALKDSSEAILSQVKILTADGLVDYNSIKGVVAGTIDPSKFKSDLTEASLTSIRSAFQHARGYNEGLIAKHLTKQWKELKKENPSVATLKLDDELSTDKAVADLSASLLNVPSNVKAYIVDVKSSEPVTAGKNAPTLKFPAWRPLVDSSKLKDKTQVIGSFSSKDSALELHVDGIDFRHLAMRAEAANKDPMAEIEKSWLLNEGDHHGFFRAIWEEHKHHLNGHTDGNGNIHKGLIAELKEKNKVPTPRELFRIEKQEILNYYRAGHVKVASSSHTHLNNSDNHDIGGGTSTKKPEPTQEELQLNEWEKFGIADNIPLLKAQLPDRTGHFPHLSIPRAEVRNNSNFTPSWNNYYAIYFVITGLHGLHVIGGALVLGYFWVFGGKMYRERPEWLTNRVEVGGLFWHFVDLVWIFLFPILYLM